MADSKIKIKLGQIEVEYEGRESFLKVELPELLKIVSALYKESGGKLHIATGEKSAPNSNSDNASLLEGTTGTIAAKLNCKTGPELIIAASARLSFVLNKEKLSRKDISDEMKTASGYYKSSYLANLTKSLNSLVGDGKLNEVSTGVYSLSSSMKSDLKSRLGSD